MALVSDEDQETFREAYAVIKMSGQLPTVGKFTGDFRPRQHGKRHIVKAETEHAACHPARKCIDSFALRPAFAITFRY